MTAGELLRAARARHGLTQRQLAIRARTSQAAISRIERGLVSPTVDTLAELLWQMNEELVLQAVPLDWGFDKQLLAANLSLSTEERLRRNAARTRKQRHIRPVRPEGPDVLASPDRGDPVTEWRTGDHRLAGNADEPG